MTPTSAPDLLSAIRHLLSLAERTPLAERLAYTEAAAWLLRQADRRHAPARELLGLRAWLHDLSPRAVA